MRAYEDNQWWRKSSDLLFSESSCETKILYKKVHLSKDMHVLLAKYI